MPPLAEATLSPAWHLAVTRSFVYALLCRVLAYPTLAHQAALRERIIPALEKCDVEGQTAELRRAIPDALDEMRAQHTSIFSLTVSADCPDYESAYNSRDVFQQTQQMADVGGFYRANGLRVGGAESERPDHITTELEFMSFLALKEAYALETRGDDELAAVVQAQMLFLRDHLACWGPGLGSRIVARAGGVSPLFAAAGALLTSWLGAECTRLGVEPASQIAEPQLEWPEPDDGACGAAGDCPLIALDEIEVAQVIPGLIRRFLRKRGVSLGVVVSVLGVAGVLQFTGVNPAASQTATLAAFTATEDPGLDPSAAVWQKVPWLQCRSRHSRVATLLAAVRSRWSRRAHCISRTTCTYASNGPIPRATKQRPRLRTSPTP